MTATTELPPSYQPTVLCLSPLVRASSLAEASRNAWRVFLEQSEGWGKAELVLWSGGLYAPIARHDRPSFSRDTLQPLLAGCVGFEELAVRDKRH